MKLEHCTKAVISTSLVCVWKNRETHGVIQKANSLCNVALMRTANRHLFLVFCVLKYEAFIVLYTVFSVVKPRNMETSFH